MGITGPAAARVAPRPTPEESRTDQARPAFASAPTQVAPDLPVEVAQLLNTDLTLDLSAVCLLGKIQRLCVALLDTTSLYGVDWQRERKEPR